MSAGASQEYSQHHHNHQLYKTPSNSSGGPFIATVVALYPFSSDKPHSLAFNRGDVINVVAKYPSGWWDGMNPNGDRGWFPSNFTQPLPDNYYQQQQQQRQQQQQQPNLTTPGSSTDDPFQSSASSLHSGITGSLGLSPAINNGIMTFDEIGNDEQEEDEEEEAEVQEAGEDDDSHELEYHSFPSSLSGVKYSFDSNSLDKDNALGINQPPSPSSSPGDPLIPSNLADYVLVNPTSDSYDHPPSYWIAQLSPNGEVSYANPARKHISSDLPFESINVNDENKQQKIPKHVIVTPEFSKSTFDEVPTGNMNDAPIYEPLLTNSMKDFRSDRSSINSKYSLTSSISFAIQGTNTGTWSGLLSHLKSRVKALTDEYSNSEDESMTVGKMFNDVASTIQTINLMAGIPPGTLPTSFNLHNNDTNDYTLSSLFRKVMNTITKLGLLCDIGTVRRQSRRESATSASSVEFSSQPENSKLLVNTNNDEIVALCQSLVNDVEQFVELYIKKKQLISRCNEVQERTDDRLDSPLPTYMVRHFKDGMWVNIVVGNNGHQVSSPFMTFDPAKPQQSLFQLESFDLSVRMDSEAVTSLQTKCDSINNNVTLITKHIEQQTSLQPQTIEGIQVRKDTLTASLYNLNNSLILVYNLIESLDLSPFYGNTRGKSSLYRSSRLKLSKDSYFYLSLLYHFLSSKQDLYDIIIELIKITRQNYNGTSTTADFITTLSQRFEEQAKITELYDKFEKSNESQIRVKLTTLTQSLEKIFEICKSLAEEKSMWSGGNNNSTSRLGSATESSLTMDYDTKALPYLRQLSTDISNGATAIKEETISGPWYLQLEYGDEMVYDRQGGPRGGTLRALVEQLTHHDKYRSDFNSAMLLTFRSFTDAKELFRLLVDRFTIQPPEGLIPEEFGVWTEKKQKPIRIRVVNILKTWLEVYWLEDDVESTGSSVGSSSQFVGDDSNHRSRTELLESMLRFANQLKLQRFPGSPALIHLIEHRMGNKDPSFKRMIKNNPAPKPQALVPKNLKKIRIPELEPLELARQLSLKEFKLYVLITANESLHRGCGSRSKNNPYGGANRNNRSHRIADFIQNSNQLTNWVSYTILKHSDAKRRAGVIKYFVQVADYCFSIHNYSSMTAIISGLYSSTIHRMKKTWDLVPQETILMLERLYKLMNSSRNFNEYRDLLNTVSPPAVPFFGVFLSDLTFTEDGNPDYLQNDSRIINFAKRMKAAATIECIRQFQTMPFNFEEIHEIQGLLINGFETAPPIEEQYDFSLAVEPREKPGTDKVARLLERNGIL